MPGGLDGFIAVKGHGYGFAIANQSIAEDLDDDSFALVGTPKAGFKGADQRQFGVDEFNCVQVDGWHGNLLRTPWPAPARHRAAARQRSMLARRMPPGSSPGLQTRAGLAI